MLPEFPRTQHLPYKPNLQTGDMTCTDKEALVVFESSRVSVEEKVDGSNCGMSIIKGDPAVRNHNHIIHKGFKGKTPAKLQFATVWNWWHEHQNLFRNLSEAGPFSIYGEWCVAQHGMEYDMLPSWFITHSLFDYDSQRWVDSQMARSVMLDCGFTPVPLLYWGQVPSYQELEALANGRSPLTHDGVREGVYVTVSDRRWITHRYKMVREGFVQGEKWSETVLNKNKLEPVS